jgi:hypothetical protein
MSSSTNDALADQVAEKVVGKVLARRCNFDDTTQNAVSPMVLHLFASFLFNPTTVKKSSLSHTITHRSSLDT